MRCFHSANATCLRIEQTDPTTRPDQIPLAIRKFYPNGLLSILLNTLRHDTALIEPPEDFRKRLQLRTGRLHTHHLSLSDMSKQRAGSYSDPSLSPAEYIVVYVEISRSS